MHGVQPVDPRAIDAQQAGRFGEQVDAAGRGTGAAQQRRGQGLGQRVSRLVLRYVAGFEPGSDHFLASRREQGGDPRLV